MTLRSHGFTALKVLLLKMVHSLKNRKNYTHFQHRYSTGFFSLWFSGRCGRWIALTASLIDLTSLFWELCPLCKCFGQQIEESNIFLPLSTDPLEVNGIQKYRSLRSKKWITRVNFLFSCYSVALSFLSNRKDYTQTQKDHTICSSQVVK